MALESTATLTMVNCTFSTSLETPTQWFPRWQSASPRSTNGCRQTDWSSIPKKPNSSGWAVLGSFRKLRSTTSLLLAAHCPFSHLWTTLECWSTVVYRCVTMCNGCVVHRTISFASSTSFETLSQWRRVQPWSTPLSQAGWTTATACLPASTRNFWTSWSRYCVRRLVLPWENGSSTQSPKTCGISSIGSQFAKGSTSNLASSSSSVFTAMLRPTWSNRCRWLPTSQISEVTDLPPAATLWCHGHEQWKWAHAVFTCQVQPCGTLSHSNFVHTNSL